MKGLRYQFVPSFSYHAHAVNISLLSAIIMPDDVAEEKVKALHALGADVQRVRPASIVDKNQVRSSAKASP